MEQAVRLGIAIQWKKSSQPKYNAAYYATPGAPGHIVLTEIEANLKPKEICTLLSHEMVHVLQHWKGKFNSLEPLGWPRDGAAVGDHKWAQEQEAYTAQSQPRKVLQAIIQLKPISQQGYP
jgi:hypothetical protein